MGQAPMAARDESATQSRHVRVARPRIRPRNLPSRGVVTFPQRAFPFVLHEIHKQAVLLIHTEASKPNSAFVPFKQPAVYRFI